MRNRNRPSVSTNPHAKVSVKKSDIYIRHAGKQRKTDGTDPVLCCFFIHENRTFTIENQGDLSYTISDNMHVLCELETISVERGMKCFIQI